MGRCHVRWLRQFRGKTNGSAPGYPRSRIKGGCNRAQTAGAWPSTRTEGVLTKWTTDSRGASTTVASDRIGLPAVSETEHCATERVRAKPRARLGSPQGPGQGRSSRSQERESLAQTATAPHLSPSLPTPWPRVPLTHSSRSTSIRCHIYFDSRALGLSSRDHGHRGLHRPHESVPSHHSYREYRSCSCLGRHLSDGVDHRSLNSSPIVPSYLLSNSHPSSLNSLLRHPCTPLYKPTAMRRPIPLLTNSQP